VLHGRTRNPRAIGASYTIARPSGRRSGDHRIGIRPRETERECGPSDLLCSGQSGLPLDVRGTAFQERVWKALQEILAGATVSYAEIARRIGAPKSVRAVAAACAANNLAVAIPCHRVIRNDGGLSGYAWGIDRKRALLDREASQNT
jgi:O-6-methylguanine DNA methyltransferase